jgi:penicillin-binding protein 2
MDRLAKVARDFGFGAPTGLGLNGDVPGRVPWKAWYEGQGGFRIGYTLNTATGQGDTEVTVVQLAVAYAAIANGGALWVPQIVEKIVASNGRLVKEFPPKLRRQIDVKPASLAAVRDGLWGTVNDLKGTGYASRPEGLGIAVAGKTGTAQVRKLYRGDAAAQSREDRDHAWFAGYAPADVPEISVVVLVEHGGKGGGVAAPIAMEIIRGYEDLKHGIAPQEPADDGAVP